MPQVEGVYRPRFNLIPHVMRVPIIPGTDPRLLYGDLAARGVKGRVLEALGVGAWLLWGQPPGPAVAAWHACVAF